ncbi:hypothetical protein D3C86_1119330 [compost metagenome]
MTEEQPKSLPKPKPSPPNWANIGSLAVASGVVLVAAVLWFARLESRVTGLEKEIAALASTQTVGAQMNDVAVSKEETCRGLADRVATAYSSVYNSSAAKPLEKLMERMGCVKPEPHPAA